MKNTKIFSIFHLKTLASSLGGFTMDNQSAIFYKLHREILSLGGIKTPAGTCMQKQGLQLLQEHFPLGVFPISAVHEFLSGNPEQLAASTGFIAATITSCLPDDAVIVWINNAQQIFPTALTRFGLQPHKIIFVNPASEQETNWCIEEALQCNSITAMVAEMTNLNFTNSRRFQLAVEKSKVTGFILNTQLNKINTTACFTRWQITPSPSHLTNGMPGVGHPRWKVQLQKIRNGKPGYWEMEWANKQFQLIDRPDIFLEKEQQLKTG